jgi:hypothetical protein
LYADVVGLEKLISKRRTEKHSSGQRPQQRKAFEVGEFSVNALVQHIAARGAHNASVFATRSAACFTTTTTNRRSQILDYLRQAGIIPRLSGSSIRIPAKWRGSSDYNVSISSRSGGFKDFVTGEKGPWALLAEKIGVGLLEEENLTPAERQARRIADQAADEENQTPNIRRAIDFYEAGRAISTRPAEEDAETLRAELAGKRPKGEKEFGGLGEARKKIPLPAEIIAAYEYLDSRQARRFAAAAKAKVGKRYDGELKIFEGWEVVWSYRLDATSTFRGIQRERGRGDGNKKMLGPFGGTSLYVAPESGVLSKILIIGEGAITTGSVWNHFDVNAWVKFSAGTLSKLDGSKFEGMTIDTVWLLCDHDTKADRAGQTACQKAAESILMHRPDFTVKIAMPATPGEDWNDVQSRTTPEKFREEFLASLADPLPPTNPDAPSSGHNRPSVSHRARRGGNLGGGAAEGSPVFDLAWHRSAPGGNLYPQEQGLPLIEGEALLKKAIADAVASLKDNKPVLIDSTTGVGKSAAIAKTLACSRVGIPMILATPRVEDAENLYEQILAAGGTAHLHAARSEDTCYKIEDVAMLTPASRSPHAWECLTCHHGFPEAAKPCKYMEKLRLSQLSMIVVCTYAAIQEDSTLKKYSIEAQGELSNARVERKIIGDEEITRSKPLGVVDRNDRQKQVGVMQTDIAAVRMMIEPAITKLDTQTHYAYLEINSLDGKERKEKLKEIKDLGKSREWARRMASLLTDLGTELGAADPALRVPLVGPLYDELRKVLGKTGVESNIPELARKHDGTILEDVSLARSLKEPIPVAWIKDLGQALDEGTAWFYKGRIVGGRRSKLWSDFISKGGINLDATPSIRSIEEVKHVGGQHIKVKVASPLLTTIQHGPHLKGRIFKADTMAANGKIIFPEFEGEPGEVAIITHQPIADMAKKHFEKTRPDGCRGQGQKNIQDFIGYWGNDEKAHNRFEKCKKLLIFGLPIPSPNVAIMEYEMDRRALLAKGIVWEPWNGETIDHEWVEIHGGREIKSKMPLPTVDDARDWIIDKITALAAQAVGRLRAVRHTTPLEVHIFGAVPLIGHGIQVDKFDTITGRLTALRDRTEQIAAALLTHFNDRGGKASRAAIAAFIAEQAGGRPSNSTITKILRRIDYAAKLNSVTMLQISQTIIRDIRLGKDEENLGATGLGGYDAPPATAAE